MICYFVSDIITTEIKERRAKDEKRIFKRFVVLLLAVKHKNIQTTCRVQSTTRSHKQQRIIKRTLQNVQQLSEAGQPATPSGAKVKTKNKIKSKRK